MSGIYGYFSNTQKLSEDDLTRLALWNKPYGKSYSTSYSDNNNHMGIHIERLSDIPYDKNIISLNENVYIIDALIYNAKELKDMYSLDDSLSYEKMIATIIENKGIEHLKNINGEFAGIIYNKSGKTITLFRDHMGIRPLFYYFSSEHIVVSTDIRGILALQATDASINEKWAYHAINQNSLLDIDETEYKNIKIVPFACYTTFNLNNLTVSAKPVKYWQPAKRKIRYKSDREYINALRELIADAVKIRLDSIDGLVGSELSGGLDSSIISILINRFGRESLYCSWSLSPDVVPLVEHDERIPVIDICKQEKITCNYRSADEDKRFPENIWETLSDLGYYGDKNRPEPLSLVFPAYMNTMPLALTSQFVSNNGGKVVFTGHGGDEGVSHRSNAFELLYHCEIYHFLRYEWSLTRYHGHRIINTIIRTASATKKGILSTLKPKYTSETNLGIINSDFAKKYKKTKSCPIMLSYNPLKYIQLGGSRNRLDVVALIGAFAGARYIAPYVDYRLIDFALSIPRHMYLKNRTNRYIFREAFKDIMPSSLYNLKTKEDVSPSSVPVKNPDWYAIQKKNKEAIASLLNTPKWQNMLNFTEVKKWVNMTEDDIIHNYTYNKDLYNILLQCAMAENTIRSAKSLTNN